MPSSNTQGNIFLTTDNLAFALPLICVCFVYAYFKYVPLNYALGILAIVFLLYQIQSYSKAHKNKKLTTLDESTIQDLAGSDDKLEQKQQQQAAKQRKAQNKLKMRLQQEEKQLRKQGKSQQKSQESDTMDEDDAMLMFAKGSRESSKKKK